MIGSERGMALVLTLLMLTLIIAMVVEFSHGVYTTTSLLVSWKESQRLTAMAKSGVNLAIAALSDPLASSKYRTVGRITIPIQEIVEGFSGAVTVTAEDEGAKFNLNSLRYPVGRLNREAHLSLKRLLRALELDERLADGIANRLLKESPFPRRPDEPYKDSTLDSTDELLLVRGIDRSAYERLLPHVTVSGAPGVLRINVNTAAAPVIMSLSDRITAAVAERIISRRSFTPFMSSPEILQVAGVDATGLSLASVAVTSSLYGITAVAEAQKVTRTIRCVVELSGSAAQVRYWLET